MAEWSETFARLSAEEQEQALTLLATKKHGGQLAPPPKVQQAQHPDLTLTDIYKVLEKLRAGGPLSDKDRRVHEQGLVSVLQQLHDELDAAVLAAYGWEDLTGFQNLSGLGDRDAEILERLVALNAERAAEEAQGLVRWLRPDYQAPDEASPQPAQQAALLAVEETAVVAPLP